MPISDFATRPPFYSYLSTYTYFYGKFFGQKIFSIKQILRMDKKYTKKVLLWLQFEFSMKKTTTFFFEFLRFSQIQGPGSKIWDWIIIVDYFPKYLTPRICFHIEMGNLEARTPCVQRVHYATFDFRENSCNIQVCVIFWL